LQFLNELINKKWDIGNAFFSPTSMQIFDIYSDNTANNVIPSEFVIKFNFRFSNELTEKEIHQKVEIILKKYQFNYKIEWLLSANPFLTKRGKLFNIVNEVIEQCCHYKPLLSTDGGTSDARFIAKMGSQIIELGHLNKTIHKVNECVSIFDLKQLCIIYNKIIKKILLEK
ncbi:MAG: M20/M25/M40 family metallo-hydrolase, partial [Arsenophonus sp. ET-DL12-MAG3]